MRGKLRHGNVPLRGIAVVAILLVIAGAATASILLLRGEQPSPPQLAAPPPIPAPGPESARALRDGQPGEVGLNPAPIAAAQGQLAAGTQTSPGHPHPSYAGEVSLLARDGVVVSRQATGFVLACGGPPPANAPRPAPPVATPPAPPPATAQPPPAETAVHLVTAGDLGASWHPGCPVPPEDLRLVDVPYLDMDGRPHTGQLIVNQDRVEQTITVFDELFRLRFPIQRIQTPDHYPGAEDELSMEDNNTSAFNCRGIPGSSEWSQHALGRAIDINPLLNPSVYKTGAFEPTTAARYLDRTRKDVGLLHDGDPAVRVFTDRGWTWGGHWADPSDYQHFKLP
ncbi:M15 family metallopeptidase [Saccharopolyspora sp. NPDC050642]|uniref:M15 family metallopeptidase n=1 Tax=Saccharopolyspora sp. NPDC050642 TaxID=3157099 RepID=UPI0033D443BB